MVQRTSSISLTWELYYQIKKFGASLELCILISQAYQALSKPAKLVLEPLRESAF